MLVSWHLPLFLLLTCVSTQLLPFTISALQYPTSFHCFIKLNRGSSMQLSSAYLTPNQLTLSTEGLKILVAPQVDPQNVLYNEPDSDRNSLGYINYFSDSNKPPTLSHFHYAKARANGFEVGLLLPTFPEQMKAFRVDQLYRCANTLISVNWVESEAQVWKFSQQDEWIHVDDLQSGYVFRDHGVLYGYAVDHNQAFPIKIRIGQDAYCLLDKRSQPARLDHNWSQQNNYSLGQILGMLEPNVELVEEQTAQEL